MVFFLILLGLVIFDTAAAIWGVDSIPGLNDPEWLRRRNWRAYAA